MAKPTRQSFESTFCPALVFLLFLVHTKQRFADIHLMSIVWLSPEEFKSTSAVEGKKLEFCSFVWHIGCFKTYCSLFSWLTLDTERIPHRHFLLGSPVRSDYHLIFNAIPIQLHVLVSHLTLEDTSTVSRENCPLYVFTKTSQSSDTKQVWVKWSTNTNGPSLHLPNRRNTMCKLRLTLMPGRTNLEEW